MLTSTLFPAPIYQSYGRMIAEKTAPVTLSGIPVKDLGLFMHVAQGLAAPAPISTHLREMLSAARA